MNTHAFPRMKKQHAAAAAPSAPRAPRAALAFALAALAAAHASTAFAAKPPPPPPSTQASITSDPAGAAVKIDGIQRGTTPLDIALTPGARLVELSLKDYENAVRTLDCAPGAAASADFKLAPVTAPVLISTEPAGVSVTRDGAFAGVTPLLLPEVPVGRYRIDLALAGYKPQQVELNVSTATPQQIKTTLINSSATLDISSEPAGATVSVNGIHRGAAPVLVDKIQEGKSIVEISAEGFAAYKEEITLAAGETFALHAKLAALPAKLTIVSTPAGAKVYIDNQLRGNTPLELPEIAAGTYRVRVELPSHEAMARTVELANKQESVEEFKLAQTVGTLRVVTSPADVSIFIGGKLFGKTTAGTNATDQISEPLDLLNVPDGENEILFQRQGYAQERQKATIVRGETLVLETVKLARMFVPDVEVLTARGSYKGLYINKDPEFYRIETSPGVIRAFPVKDITQIRLIRDTNIEDDIESK